MLPMQLQDPEPVRLIPDAPREEIDDTNADHAAAMLRSAYRVIYGDPVYVARWDDDEPV